MTKCGNKAGTSLTSTATRIWLATASVFIAIAALGVGSASAPTRAADTAGQPTPMDSDTGTWVGQTDSAILVLTKDGSQKTAKLTIKKLKQTFDCTDISIGKSGSVDMWCGQKNHGLRTQGYLIRGTFPTLQMQPGGDYSAGSDQGPIPVTYRGPASK